MRKYADVFDELPPRVMLRAGLATDNVIFIYGAECWVVRKKDRKLHTTEICMMRWARGKTRLDRVRNVDIWKEVYIIYIYVSDGKIPQREEVDMV